MKKKVGIGIIGTGFAKTVQIPAFQSVKGAEVVSVASGRAENAAKVANEFGIAHHTGDWRETVKHPDTDLICITTPPVFHKEMTLFALENNKHVLCEKPMAMNFAEAREIQKKAAGKNLLCLIDHELRFLNGRKKALEIIRSGKIGKIRHAKYNFRAPHRGDVNLPFTWWSDEKYGGGALGAIGSHAVDTLQWLSDAEITEVFCRLQTHVKERKDEKTGKMRRVTTDDEANLIIKFGKSEFTEDATGVISLSMVEYPEYQNRVEIFGTKGAIRIEFDGEIFISDIKNEKWKSLKVKINPAVKGVKNTGWNNGFLAFAEEIVKALRKGETIVENAATFADGCKVQKVLDAARESDKKGCKVKI